MAKDFNQELHRLIEQLEKYWNVNDIQRFLNTNQMISVIFTHKIQAIIDEKLAKEVTYTFDLESKGAEEKLQRINSMLDAALRKRHQLNAELVRNEELQTQIDKRKNESNN